MDGGMNGWMDLLVDMRIIRFKVQDMVEADDSSKRVSLSLWVNCQVRLSY